MISLKSHNNIYGTSLIRNHTMQGALAEMQIQDIPTEVIEKLKESVNCNLYFFGSHVNIGTIYDTWNHYFDIDWNLYFVKQIKKIQQLI